VTRILLVEDDPRGAQTVREILAELPGQVDPFVVGSRDAAFAALSEHFFDLLILDLNIPADDTGGASQPEFGYAVVGRAKELAPGMPIFLFTGSSTENFVEDLLLRVQQIEVWGVTKVPTVALQRKIKLEDFAEVLLPFVAGPHALSEVELDRGGLDLSVEERRLLRIFSKRYRGVKCVVSPLSGGLSEARVLRVVLFDPQGAVIHQAVGKIARIPEIQREKDLYEQHVARLRSAATPRLLVALEFGAKSMGAIFYQLAAGHDQSFFDFQIANAALVSTAVVGTRVCMTEWHEAGARNMYSVAHIRRRLLTDEARDRILADYDLAWTVAFEHANVNARWGCIHGDCHGGNVLLTAGGAAMVIDYGDIGPGPLAVDPVTLELSMFFHPNGALVDSAWPSPECAQNWGNLERYLNGCPCPDFISQCRAWARHVAGGNREIAASAYAYLMRQLKYPNTNKARALDLLAGIRQFYEST
jgi:CheY-like chemotaxis protein